MSEPKSIIKLFHDGKSGLEGLDSEKINQIINDTTRGSNFYNFKLKKEQKIEAKVELMKQRLESSTFIERENAKKTIDNLKKEYEEIGKDLSHIVVHIDMDQFFVAVEIRDNPSLADKPCAVGDKSMISTSNYNARKFGVRAGMPGFIGLKLCPQLLLIPGRYHQYKEESKKITEVILEYDETFRPYSLDECSIDLTPYLVKKCSLPDSKIKFEIKQNKNGESVLSDEIWNLADEVVQEIRKKVFEKTQLTCSAGIAHNKMLAKICSDINKPNNQFMLKGNSSKDIINFIQKLNVKKIPFIGPTMQHLLKGFNIETVQQLYNNLEKLTIVFSLNQIEFFTRVSLGVSSFEMSNDEDYNRKSESRETTFNSTNDQAFILNVLKELCDCLNSSLTKHNLKGKTITLKIKNQNFEVFTRSKTIANYIDDSESIYEIGKKLLLKEMNGKSDIFLRLIGIRLSNFLDENADKNQYAKIDELFKRKNLENNQSTSKNELNKNVIDNLIDEIEINRDNSNDCNTNLVNQKSSQNNFICPVCSIRKFSELNELNEHVDYCLSKEEIMKQVKEINDGSIVSKELTELDQQSSNKRKSSDKNLDSPTKKKKITEYFKKK